MSRVVGGPHKAEPLRTARTPAREFRPLTISPAMRAVAERCSTPQQVSMASRVPLNEEAGRVQTRSDNWRRR